MKLLITGGSGLLGSKIAEIAEKRGLEVYSGYNEHEAIYGNPVKLNICDKNNVIKTFECLKPEAVVHAAALTHVDRCEKNKELAREVNVEGTENIVCSSEFHNSFIVYISTDYVFSGEEGMYDETDETDPINYYGQTKLEAEKIVTESKSDWCIARPSVIYGSSPAAGKENFVLWILNRLKKNEAVRIITDQWVSPTLNTNLAEMILEIIKRKLTGIYHLAGATPINRYEYAKLIAEKFQLDKTLISPTKSSEMNWLAKRPKNSSLNVEKASKTLKNKPLEIEEALDILKNELIIK